MQLKWIKCQGDVWGNLNTVNLAHPHFESLSGVYVIWHGGSNPATVRVGQGDIKARLTDHRNDPAVQKYVEQTLYVTWASVPKASRDGVEVFLADKLMPTVRDNFPKTSPIEVNLPW